MIEISQLVKVILFLTAFEMFLITIHELVNTTCCVNELHLTCVEWVRAA